MFQIPDGTTLSVGPNEIENTTDENMQSLQSVSMIIK